MSTLADRLLAAVIPCVVPDRPSGCWIWRKAQTTDGYGKIGVEGKTCRAHRVAYKVFVGEIPEGYQVHHTCVEQGFGSTLCINPHHLEAVTHIENTRRGDAGKHLTERTHCPRGHIYAGENLMVEADGFRRCRTCRREQARAYRGRQRERQRAAERLPEREAA